MADNAAPFAQMAERIARLAGGEFAGAVVIVPPGDGKPIAFLYADPEPNAPQFWASAKARVEEGAIDAQDADARGIPWQARR